MSRFGLTLWSPNSEVFVMGVVGMIVSCAETPLYSVRPDMREVWNLDLPPERFSVALQYVLRLILINVIIVRFITVHCYVISFLFITWPVFLEEQPWMLLPWLVVGGVKHIVLELIVLLTGSFMFMRYGSPFNLFCVEFLVIKGVTLAFSIYLWVSVLFLYCDLANPPQMFSRDETSSNKRLEVAIRRRMCKSLCTEVVWRRRMLEDLDNGGVVHVTVSLEEDLLTEQNIRTKPQTRSLDSILDKMGYDWDLLDDLSTRRALEGKGTNVPLPLKARKFLQLSKNEIDEAKKTKFNLKDTEDKSTQTNTLSKRFLDAYSKQSMLFAKSQASAGVPSSHSTGTNSELPEESPIPRLSHKFSPITLRPEMSGRAPPPSAEQRVHSLLKNLNITMPPRYGYRHATTQVNNISRKYLQEDSRARQKVSSESTAESASHWTPVDYDNESLVSSLTEKNTCPVVPHVGSTVVAVCTDSGLNSAEDSASSLVPSTSTSADGPATPGDDEDSVDLMATGSVCESSSATDLEREVPQKEEATPGPTSGDGRNELKTPVKESWPSFYTAVISESKSPFVIRKDFRSKSENTSQCENAPGELEIETSNVIPATLAEDSVEERGSEVSIVKHTQNKLRETLTIDAQAKQAGMKGKKRTEKVSGISNIAMPGTSKDKREISAHNNSEHSPSVMGLLESPSAGSRSSEMSVIKSEPAQIKKQVSLLSPSISAAWSSLDEDLPRSRPVRLTQTRGVAPDGAVPGTSRDRVSLDPSVYSLSLLESDYAFGMARAGPNVDDGTRQRVWLPPSQPHRSISKTFKMDSRPSIRTIKMYANTASPSPLKTSDAGNYGKSLPPLSLVPQQTKRLTIDTKKPERGSSARKQKGSPSQSVSLAIDVSDTAPTEDRWQIADSAISELEEEAWKDTPAPMSKQRDEALLIKKALAFNEEKLEQATRKHEKGRPTSVLHLLADDEDFDFALPQTSQVAVRRDSSGSLNEFLAKMKGADSENAKL